MKTYLVEFQNPKVGQTSDSNFLLGKQLSDVTTDTHCVPCVTSSDDHFTQGGATEKTCNKGEDKQGLN